ncbi:MAG: hypothetical protein IPL11_09195 [Candidatus Accumulibacter sp.]|uniref:hypothetical protein n=1 Tax=Accumulibacter sp. TaxID=2053492 RepID=UPI001AC7FABA|nr:hypothetical protein [Accumulibacter sp.]MBK8385819.1 hypothetical protein [Accumulibacter sp.]MBN8436464.1 hypothetical protein [Accumulibacter sp.]
MRLSQRLCVALATLALRQSAAGQSLCAPHAAKLILLRNLRTGSSPLMLSIEFESAKFLPYLPESSQANPGAYGFELALWLSQALMRAGIVTSYPLGEDWGWFIEYLAGEAEFMIGCGSRADAGEGYTGQPIAWHVFIKQQLSLRQRLTGGAAPQVVATLAQAIQAALAAEGITPIVEGAA